MIANFTTWLYPLSFAIVTLTVGLGAAIGYYRTQAQKVWRESAEGWKTENEANKERADRLAEELAHTATELKQANMRTDITAVLEVLQGQHKEATGILTRIADEGEKRAQKHEMLLRRIADESAERNGHIAEILTEHGKEEARVWVKIVEIADETLRTVKELEKVAHENPTPPTRRRRRPAAAA